MGKKKGKKKKISAVPEVDKPLASFVDSPEKRLRVKKSDSSASFKDITNSSSKEEEVVDDWFNLDDEVIDLATSIDINLDISTTPKNEQKKMTSFKYREFPLDFWFLLGEYIEPEQVGKFALLCKSSYSVTLSHTFWRSLYSRIYYRYCSNNDNLIRDIPERLRPDSMHRPKGLRSCVIRFLHLCHPPFLSLATHTLHHLA